MNVTCTDRERIFLDGTPEEWAALEAHAENCFGCAEEFRAWKSLSIAAQELRNYTPSPGLWSRTADSLSKESLHTNEPVEHRNWGGFWCSLSLGWQAAAAAALLVLLVTPASWFYLEHQKANTGGDSSLLKNKALFEVERTESAYVKAIDKLAQSARPQLENPSTPLLESYREKLLVLDSAIDDLRAQAGQNSSNAHLRHQLLAMYQEKQRTLEEILEEKR